MCARLWIARLLWKRNFLPQYSHACTASADVLFLGDEGFDGGVDADLGVEVIACGVCGAVDSSLMGGDKLCGRLPLPLPVVPLLLLLLLLLLMLLLILLLLLLLFPLDNVVELTVLVADPVGSCCKGDGLAKGGECFLGDGELAVAAPGLVVPASCLNRCE